MGRRLSRVWRCERHFEYRKQGSAGPAHEAGHQAKNRAVVQSGWLPQQKPVRGAGGEFLRGSSGRPGRQRHIAQGSTLVPGWAAGDV